MFFSHVSFGHERSKQTACMFWCMFGVLLHKTTTILTCPAVSANYIKSWPSASLYVTQHWIRHTMQGTATFRNKPLQLFVTWSPHPHNVCHYSENTMRICLPPTLQSPLRMQLCPPFSMAVTLWTMCKVSFISSPLLHSWLSPPHPTEPIRTELHNNNLLCERLSVSLWLRENLE